MSQFQIEGDNNSLLIYSYKFPSVFASLWDECCTQAPHCHDNTILTCFHSKSGWELATPTRIHTHQVEYRINLSVEINTPSVMWIKKAVSKAVTLYTSSVALRPIWGIQFHLGKWINWTCFSSISSVHINLAAPWQPNLRCVWTWSQIMAYFDLDINPVLFSFWASALRLIPALRVSFSAQAIP